jgi:SAM-dependent methyltransferase
MSSNNKAMCPLCNSNNVVLKWNNARRYKVNECLDCSFFFLDEMPNEKDLEKFYSENYFMASYASKNQNLIIDANNPKIFSDAKSYSALIKTYNPEATHLCEVGCSWGYLLYNLQKLGYSVKGYELSSTTAAEGIKQLGLNITTGFFEPEDHKFDVVILRHVLEHLTNPRDILEKIYESLADGGLFFLEGPNLDSISSRLFNENVSWVSPPDHVSFPNFRSLLIAGEELGFTCVYKTSRRGRGISVFHQALLNTIGIFFGSKEKAKENLGGINEKANSQLLTLTKKVALNFVTLLDFLTLPIHPLLKSALLEEEMLIIFKK